VTTPADKDVAQEQARALAQRAMEMVCVSLPHLSGLAHAVEVIVDDRVPSAAVTASGRLLISPSWFGALTLGDAAFVFAHELLHLALRHHQRAAESDDHHDANIVQDWIINDMLCEALEHHVPCGGLYRHGARHRSFEELLLVLNEGRRQGEIEACCSWVGDTPVEGRSEINPMQAALEQAGLVAQAPRHAERTTPEIDGFDLINLEQERALFPEETRHALGERQRLITQLAEQAAALVEIQRMVESTTSGDVLSTGITAFELHAAQVHYRPPWQRALQRWMDAVAPGQRSWARASRRGGQRSDIVLPGRKREGWTLHIVMDTSGSMTDTLALVLGAIASFCRASGVGEIHIVQCDTEVSVDEWLTPDELHRYRIAGYGGSDMSPAMHRLGADPEVEAALVITDGWIDYPTQPMPYDVLWVLTANCRRFNPPYGSVIPMLG